MTISPVNPHSPPNATSAAKRRHEAAAAKRREDEERRLLEKQAADKAEKENEEKAKAAREKKKKERDALRKEEQEEKKKQEEAKRQKEVTERLQKEAEEKARQAADTSNDEDMPDKNINEHLQDVNTGGGDEQMEEPPATEAETNGVSSPKKKKSRKEKKDKKKSKKDKAAREMEAEKDQEKVAKTFAEVTRSPSLIKTGRYSAGGGAAEKANQAKRKEMAMYMHKHSRWILELSIKLTSEDTHAELVMAIRQLLENAQRVCPMAVIAPAKEDHCDPLYFTGDVSFNLSILNRHIRIQDAHKAFTPKKPWGKDKEDVELEAPVVYFSLAFSTDEDPEDVIEGVAGEWSRSNGMKMYRKNLPSFKTQTPVCFFFVSNSATSKTITAEVTSVLEEARDNKAMNR